MADQQEGRDLERSVWTMGERFAHLSTAFEKSITALNERLDKLESSSKEDARFERSEWINAIKEKDAIYEKRFDLWQERQEKENNAIREALKALDAKTEKKLEPVQKFFLMAMGALVLLAYLYKPWLEKIIK